MTLFDLNQEFNQDLKKHLTIFLFSVQVAVVSLLSFSAFSNEHVKVPDYDDRKPKMVSQSVYKKMTAAQEALLSERYEEAVVYLNQILKKGKKLKPYDQAKIFEMLSSVNLAMGDHKNAIKYSQQAIALEVLNRESEVQIFHRLIYLYFFLEDYQEAIAHLQIWFSLESNPTIKTYFSAAQIYAASDNMNKALEFALKGMAVLKEAKNKSATQEAGGPAIQPELKENWIKLLIAIRLHLKDYQNVSQNLEQAISLWPQRAEYYQQLSAVYQELKREKEALVILSLAYQNALIDKEVDINRLGQQYSYHSNPFKGAKILEKGFKLERLKPTEKNWEAMANALLHAREWQQANSALQKAAKRSSKGILWLQLCQTSTQGELWQDAKNYCQKAIKKGQLKDEEGTARYLIALSEYYQEKFAQAVKSFNTCSEWKKTEKTCSSWKTYVEQTIVKREEEEEIIRQNNTERLRRQQNQQEVIDKALLRKI